MRKLIYPSTLLLAGMLGVVVASPVFSVEQPTIVTIQLPEEPIVFMAGPGLQAAGKNCVKCHSADYIYMQPPLTQEQWQATVMKMKKSYGAPIDDGETGAIVNYLMSQNGTSQQVPLIDRFYIATNSNYWLVTGHIVDDQFPVIGVVKFGGLLEGQVAMPLPNGNFYYLTTMPPGTTGIVTAVFIDGDGLVSSPVVFDVG